MPEQESPTRPTIFDMQFGSREVLDLISEKWTVLIIYALACGVKRHGELKRQIRGISQKMLTQTLRSLERDGLVERTDYQVIPPRVDYRLTPLGQSLGELLKGICDWSEEHYTTIAHARELHYQKKHVEVASLQEAELQRIVL